MDVGSVYHVTDSVDAPSWNPFDPDFLLNPYPHYARLRDEDPVHRTPLGVLVVSRYDDCLLYTSPSPRDQRGSRMPSSA